ncbi:hypothetical protein Tco_0671654 [Tanacetum coccineum]
MRKVWKPTGKVFTEIGYSWKPTRRIFTIDGNRCPLTGITYTKEVPLKESTITPVITPSLELKVYSRKPKASRSVVQIILWYLESGCSKHMTGNRSQLINFISKFLGTVKFGNDHIAKIMGYGDYQMGNVTISRFWYTIKKVKESDSYEFLLANKKYIVDANVFRKILDICPRVEGEEFTEVQDNDATLTFLIDLGYKGSLHKYTNMYVDHMHQPWRTVEAIINKCLSGKTASNNRLRKSRIDILWGMFYRENVDYPELI